MDFCLLLIIWVKILVKSYKQKLADHDKQSATYAFKIASKRGIQKRAEPAADLISNKNEDKITQVSRTSPQNNSETVTNEEKKYGA